MGSRGAESLDVVTPARVAVLVVDLATRASHLVMGSSKPIYCEKACEPVAAAP